VVGFNVIGSDRDLIHSVFNNSARTVNIQLDLKAYNLLDVKRFIFDIIERVALISLVARHHIQSHAMLSSHSGNQLERTRSRIIHLGHLT
jgi:hypothetical protein